MKFDPLFLIAVGGMVFAVIAVALFMRRSSSEMEADLKPARKESVFQDDHALVCRYYCPDCGQLLRQEVELTTPKPRQQTVTAESGYTKGSAVCPECGTRIKLST